MIKLSLGLNIFVLVGVCTALIAFGGTEPIISTWGPYTAARGILLSIYISILVVSCTLLFYFWREPNSDASEFMVSALLVVQIVYKISTPFTVSIQNQCVISNLAISAVHCITLRYLWKRHRGALLTPAVGL